MPKLKTKSSVKKRFKLSAKGKVITAYSGKRHGMIKRTPKQIRQKRGTDTMEPADAKIVKGWMPYGVRGRRLKPSRTSSDGNQDS